MWHKILISKVKQWSHDALKVRIFIGVFIFIITFVGYLFYWNDVRNSVRKDFLSAHENQSRIISDLLTSRLLQYQTFQNSVSEFFQVNSNPNQTSFASFVNSFHLTNNFPEIDRVCFIQYVPQENLQYYVQTMSQQWPNFTVQQSSDTYYLPITYFVNFNNYSGRPPGFNEATNNTVKTTINKSLSSGRATMTSMFTINNTPIFVVFQPVYQPGTSPTNLVSRQQDLLGYDYLVLNYKVLTNNLQNENPNPNFAIALFDPTSNNKLSFKTANYNKIIAEKGDQSTSLNINLFNHPWRIVYLSSPALLSPEERQLPSLSLWRGIFISIALSVGIYYVIATRERRVKAANLREIQNAKDELLSLASHQLRTPATVVKQYIGLLLEGYGGKISKQQKYMLQSAYDSNERQIEIIKQLLYVARLDSGRINLKPEKLNIVKLFKEIIDNEKSFSNERKQKILEKFPEKNIFVEGDSQYLYMALDNILNNAIKYTAEKGNILVGITNHKGFITLSIKDNGVGMTQDDLAKIFEKFSRVENELSTDVNGSGLGLYLSDKIIKLHNGTIHVNSEVNVGTEFIIELPKKRKKINNE